MQSPSHPDLQSNRSGFFFQKYMSSGCSVCCVRLRRFRKGKGESGFKGSVFVEFSSPREAKRIAALNIPSPTGEPMVMMMKEEYIKNKSEEFAKRRNEHNNKHG